MYLGESFVMDVKKIDIVHEFVLDREHRCEYPNGRGLYGIVHCIHGTAEYRFSSGERIIISQGDTLLLSPLAGYSIFTQREFRHYTVNFTIHASSSHLNALNAPYCLLRKTASEQIHMRLNKLVKSWEQKNPGYEMLAISHLYALLSLFYFEYKNSSIPSEALIRVQPAKEYIEQSFMLPITLEQLARRCDMSVTNFRREWQKIYTVTPMQYRDEIKLAYAKECLIKGVYSVSEVSCKCGFESTGYFIRFFKKHTGTTPNKFKKCSIIL